MPQTFIRNNAQGLICSNEIHDPFEFPLLGIKWIENLGLSIGQSLSVTMAMERSFGEKGLTDFDKLEKQEYCKAFRQKLDIKEKVWG